jgi:hypothetical protein
MRVAQWRCPFGNWGIEIIALILGGFTKDLISDLENDQFLCRSKLLQSGVKPPFLLVRIFISVVSSS